MTDNVTYDFPLLNGQEFRHSCLTVSQIRDGRLQEGLLSHARLGAE